MQKYTWVTVAVITKVKGSVGTRAAFYDAASVVNSLEDEIVCSCAVAMFFEIWHRSIFILEGLELGVVSVLLNDLVTDLILDNNFKLVVEAVI